MFIFATEEYDAAQTLKKYAIKLTDGERSTLHSRDLDTKRGQHIHENDRGEKLSGHLPWSGSLTEVAAEMMELMRMY